jgi:hypothetical protein
MQKDYTYRGIICLLIHIYAFYCSFNNWLTLKNMKNIPIENADGSEPLPICRGNREWLIQYYKVPEMIVLRYFMDGTPVEQTKVNEESKAIVHLRQCPKCKPWISTLVPHDMFIRQSRQSKYCCSGMFCAIEESAKRGTPKISFTMFRGEDPCWQLDGNNAFLRFCPWCGKKLPDKPFIND